MANINQMIADLDSQINSLQTARQALAEAHGVGAAQQAGPRRMSNVSRFGVAGARPKRVMSDEAREKIRAAQKLRWAKVASSKASPNKAATKMVVTKKVATPRRPKAQKVTPTVEAPAESVAVE